MSDGIRSPFRIPASPLSAPARPARIGERIQGSFAWILAVLAPLLFVLAVGWFIWAAVDGLGNHENLAIVVAVVGLLGLFVATIGFWSDYTGKGSWSGACPVCGKERVWKFYAGAGVWRDSLACEQCAAQVRLPKLGVMESSLEEVEPAAVSDTLFGGFKLPLDKLWDAGRLPPRPQMPEGCAMCGAPATKHLPVQWRIATGTEDPIYGTRRMGGRRDTSRPRFNVEELQFGLCDAHDKPWAVCYESGELKFWLYGGYREFCRLNGLRPAGR